MLKLAQSWLEIMWNRRQRASYHKNYDTFLRLLRLPVMARLTLYYPQVLIRGCRCIEIDVWDGEAPAQGAPQRPHLPSSISSHSHSLSQTAASAVSAAMKEAKEKYQHGKEVGKSMIAEKTHHHHWIPSINHSDHSDANSSGSVEKASKIDSEAVDEALEKTPSASLLASRHSSTASAMGEPLEKTVSGHLHIRHNSSSSMRPEPRVLHGWTLTSEVSFRDVCKTIRETAFQTTNLPLIVSLEVHACLEQQEIMVEIMKEEWNGLLIDEAHPACNPAERLPYLNELFNKVGVPAMTDKRHILATV